MGEYTRFLEDKSYLIFEEENYLEELEKATELFRTFDQALDRFIVEHGFEGDVGNIDEKVAFLTAKLQTAGIPIPRNMRKWYSEHRKIERKTAFQICFAFGLKVNEVDDFFRRICLARGFDCHLVEEVICFFAFQHGLSYQEMLEIREQAPSVKPARMTEKEQVYTDLIIDEIGSLETAEELIAYLNENVEKFGYNNATACESIRTLWKEISGADGIAIREKKLMYRSFDKGQKDRERMDDSIWEICLQILGLSGSYMADYYKGRSLKFILKDNRLLHPLAEDSFPDRDGLNKILIGEHVSHERVRKTLILLAFYQFWGNRALNGRSYEAGYGDSDRCIAMLNSHLMEAGYPMLYPGNPYDFVILMSVNADYPLMTFRNFMQELFFEKTDGRETD